MKVKWVSKTAKCITFDLTDSTNRICQRVYLRRGSPQSTEWVGDMAGAVLHVTSSMAELYVGTDSNKRTVTMWLGSGTPLFKIRNLVKQMDLLVKRQSVLDFYRRLESSGEW